MFFWAGVFFAGDLALWHASLLLTSVAASTLEANCAPMVVTLGAWALWGERPRPSFLLALALASVGLLLIVSTKFAHGPPALAGDLLGLGTAGFYGFYILAVARLRTRYGAGIVMFNSTLVFTLLLLPLALTQKFLPDTPHGWLLLVGCALSAQVLGQGLVAYALAHLPATFSSVGLYLQSIAATAYAWLPAEGTAHAVAACGRVHRARRDCARAPRAPHAAPGPGGAPGASAAARVDPVERAAPQRVAVTLGEEAVMADGAHTDLCGRGPAPLDLRLRVGS